MKTTKTKRAPLFRRDIHFRNWRIASKLLVVSLCLSLIPLLLATWISSQHTVSVLTEEARLNLARLGHSTAQDVSRSLLAGHEIMRIAASDPQTVALLKAPTAAERQQLTGQADVHIRNIMSANPAVDAVGLYNAKGIAVAHSDPTAVGNDLSLREHVRRALAGEDFTSDLQIDPKTQTLGIFASQPVKDGSQVIGAIAIHITADYITTILRDSLDVQGGGISDSELQSIGTFLVSRNGIVVISLKDQSWQYLSSGAGTASNTTTPAALLKKANPTTPALAKELQAALDAGQAGSERYCRPSVPTQAVSTGACSGDWHVVGYAPVHAAVSVGAAPARLFMVVVDLPERIFLQGVARQTLQGVAISVVIALLAVLASFRVAQTISRPIKKLSNVAQSVEHDEQFEPERVADIASQGDEVGYLSRVFRDMVLALRARMTELHTIYDCGRVIGLSVDLRQTIYYLLISIAKVVPYDVAEVSLYDKNRGVMVLQAVAKGQKIEPVDGVVYKADQGLTARVISKHDGLLVSDESAIKQDSAQAGRSWRDMQPGVYMGMPFFVKGELTGVMEFVHRDSNAFNRDQLRVLESIAMQASVAIQNAVEVQNHERSLKEQIQALRIEVDDLKRQKQVEEIVSTDYFQRLREQAKLIRKREGDGVEGAAGSVDGGGATIE